MSINTNQITAQAFRAVSDREFQATLGRIGTHAVGLSKELVKALAQWRNLYEMAPSVSAGTPRVSA